MKSRFLIPGLWLGLALTAAQPAQAQRDVAGPPNLVEISGQLVTSGQPSAAWLSTAAARGFDAVIYLAPPTVRDAVAEEPLILGRQGIVYINIPVDFAAPSARDVETFFGAMQALEGRRVLVHCQINMRASTFVFLYRSIVLREDPVTAYLGVERVWVPAGPWRELIVAELRRHDIDFEPL